MKSKVIFSLIMIAAHWQIEAFAANWLDHEKPIAFAKLLSNISADGTLKGTVIASPQRENPNYFFHWTRDAGLVMDALITEFANSRSQEERSRLEQRIKDYIAVELIHQTGDSWAGLGEPKFEVDGSPFRGEWGRPQNDGPALRAIAVMHYARLLLAAGKNIGPDLYDGKIPTNSLIKRDLEFVAHHWRDPSFDLWEEVYGDHFYTRMVQRRALLEGAEFAQTMGDLGAADWYRRQAWDLSVEIEKHYDSSAGLIKPTLNRRGGLDYKNSDIDIAVILGVLHGNTNDGFFSYSDPRVVRYMERIVSTFARAYAINHRSEIPGTAIGRYPEDRYAGDNFNGGNPWVLTTLAVAELYYQQGRPEIAGRFVDRVKYHANPDGSLSEQIFRDSGFMISARDLTWNYAAVLTCAQARESKR